MGLRSRGRINRCNLNRCRSRVTQPQHEIATLLHGLLDCEAIIYYFPYRAMQSMYSHILALRLISVLSLLGIRKTAKRY